MVNIISLFSNKESYVLHLHTVLHPHKYKSPYFVLLVYEKITFKWSNLIFFFFGLYSPIDFFFHEKKKILYFMIHKLFFRLRNLDYII